MGFMDIYSWSMIEMTIGWDFSMTLIVISWHSMGIHHRFERFIILNLLSGFVDFPNRKATTE